MIRAFAYYLSCHFKNLATHRLRRLRQPKYLVSALIGVAYLYFLFIHRAFFTGSRGRPVGMLPWNTELEPLIEIGFALVLLVMSIVPWILPMSGRSLLFTEAEIQFLFPAPVSRRALLHFRLARGQVGILVGVLVTVLIFGRGIPFPQVPFLAVGLWLTYSFLALYHLGVHLTRTSLEEHGISGLKRQAWILALITAAVGSIVVWFQWFMPAPPVLDEVRFQALLDWLLHVAESGPAFYLLWPFRALVRPAMASSILEFLRYLLPALAPVVLAYLWVMRSDVRFEEAALERSEIAARKLEALRSGAPDLLPRNGRQVRRPFFRLEGEGHPFVALFWKNLIAAGRINLRRLVPILIVMIVATVIPLSRGSSGSSLLPEVVALLALVAAGVLTMIGPVLLRDDLRSDLLKIDLIKTYPIPGWGVVLGEVLGPATILTALQWVLLLLAALLLPELGDTPLSPVDRVAYGLTAAIVFPCLSVMGLLVQNGTALIMPGWVQLGRERHGVEAMGQRLISMVVTGVVLVCVVVPAGLVFAITSLAGYWVLGKGVFPLAASLAALIMLAEAGLLVLWLGRFFDRFDASMEIR